MKKWQRICAAVAAGVVLAAGTPFSGVTAYLPEAVVTASAEEDTYGDLTYTYLEDGTIEITGCDASATEVEIPGEIEGVAVTSIGVSAFMDCTSLLEVTIPDSVGR